MLPKIFNNPIIIIGTLLNLDWYGAKIISEWAPLEIILEIFSMLCNTIKVGIKPPSKIFKNLIENI